MKDLIIGIDGGGSKTAFLLADLELKQIKTVIKPRSNPNDIGIENAALLLSQGIDELTQNCQKDRIAAVFAGIAGVSAKDYAQKLQTAIKEKFPDIPVGVLHDGINVLYSAFPKSDGVSIICGTGSSCFVKKKNEIFRIGGYGSFDFYGNGYEIGRAGIAHALRVEDGRDKPSALAEAIREKFGNSLVAVIGELCAMSKTELAAVAPIVCDAYENGDYAAKIIIENNIGYVAELIKHANDYFQDGCCVALAGGIFKRESCVLLLNSLIPKNTKTLIPNREPCFGAAAKALEMLNLAK